MRRLAATTLAFLCSTAFADTEQYLQGFRGAEMQRGAIFLTHEGLKEKEEPVAFKDVRKQLYFRDLEGKIVPVTGRKFSLRPGTIYSLADEKGVPVYEARLDLEIGPYVCDEGTFELLVAPKHDSRLEREVWLVRDGKRKAIMVDAPVFDHEYACGQYDLVSKVLYEGDVLFEETFSIGKK